jgi:hypothetical protein
VNITDDCEHKAKSAVIVRMGARSVNLRPWKAPHAVAMHVLGFFS